MQRLLIAGLAAAAAAGCAAKPTSIYTAASVVKLALVGATVYPAPDEPAIADAVVLVGSDGKIAAVGPRATTAVPPGIETLELSGRFVTAGLWNCHVHFSPPEVPDAREAPAAALAALVEERTLRHGFTTVVDTGSLLPSTVALRDRIGRGEFAGPKIYTAGEPIYARDGIPFYLRDVFAELHITPDQVADAAGATAAVRARLDGGADLIKLFTGAPVPGHKVVTMSPEAVAAAVAEAHQRGKLVFSHPQSLAGMKVAVENGVDVLAHLAPEAGPLPADFLKELRDHQTAIIPTMTLWRAGLMQEGASEAAATEFQARGREQLRGLHAAGVEILFGTDVGYVRVTDTSEELRQMAAAGMDFPSLLASLTTLPARRFGGDARVAAGLPADLVVLDTDPRVDPTAWARPSRTLRAGRVVFSTETAR